MNCVFPNQPNSSGHNSAEGYSVQGLDECLRNIKMDMKATTIIEEAIRPMFEKSSTVPMSKAALLDLMFTAFKLGKQMESQYV